MSAHVQSRNAGTSSSDRAPVQAAPGALTADPDRAAALARGRALQARAVREGFGAALRLVFAPWGRMRYVGRRSTAS